jgi:hypothetical protein
MNILVIAPEPFFAIRKAPPAVRELVTAMGGRGNRVNLLTDHLGEDIVIPGVTHTRTKAFSHAKSPGDP